MQTIIAPILFFVVLAVAAPGHLIRDLGRSVHGVSRRSDDDATTSYLSGHATFDQLIDHQNPSLGTFKQSYWYSTEFWAGPGSPVVLENNGEQNVTGGVSNLGLVQIQGMLAQGLGAAQILIEHRYWGSSSPFDDLTTENLQYLTLENSILDMTNFANNVELPWATQWAKTNADTVPWVLIGGSYPGALAAWVEHVAPGTFWAYLASSAVVEAIEDFWQYWEPVRLGMPSNCSSDVSAVIDFMDYVLVNGSSQEQQDLKAMFGLEGIERGDVFMDLLSAGPFLWQDGDFDHRSNFYLWCDYIENSVNQTDESLLPTSDGVGLQDALSGYASWFKDTQLPTYCIDGDCTNGYDFSTADTYDASNPLFTDRSLTQGQRQWEWMLCNEPFGWRQTGAPEGQPTLLSRLLNAEYYSRQCALYFPPGPNGETYGLARGRTAADINDYTGGWNHSDASRVVFTNGEFDPWRDATVSADSRPGGPMGSSSKTSVNLVPGGFHCSDFGELNGEVNAGLAAVQQAEIQQIAHFVSQWPKKMSDHIIAGLS